MDQQPVSKDGNLLPAVPGHMSDDDDDCLVFSPFTTPRNGTTDKSRLASKMCQKSKVTPTPLLAQPQNHLQYLIRETSSIRNLNTTGSSLSNTSSENFKNNVALDSFVLDDNTEDTKNETIQKKSLHRDETKDDDSLLRSLLGNDIKRTRLPLLDLPSNGCQTDSESDDGEENQALDEKQTINSPKKKLKLDFEEATRNVSKNKVLPILTSEEKIFALSKIQSKQDRVLRDLLWQANFHYTLFPHQFEGIRAVAGLPRRTNSKQQPQQKQKVSSTEDAIVPGTRGILLADDMGLGKTIQAIGGAMLRNKFRIPNKNNLPTIICAPNSEILKQWEETLLTTGVPRTKIHYFVPHRTKQLPSSSFILLTHHSIASETRNAMNNIHERPFRSSMLFPNIPRGILEIFLNQYQAINGKAQNLYRQPGETCQSVITTRSAKAKDIKPIFKTLIIDEAHFLRNLTAYWGIGATLMALHAERTVALTGTPYNNGAQDLATLMTMIDPKHPSSYKSFWENATKGGSVERVVEAVAEWRTNYMLRREKDILLQELPPKHVVTNSIPVSGSELFTYSRHEGQLICFLERLRRLEKETENPKTIRKKKQLFMIMMSTMASMRMSLIHPVLPQGREITKLFSPSRCHTTRQEENQYTCVVCQKRYKGGAESKNGKHESMASIDLDDPEICDDDPDMLSDDEEEDLSPVLPLGPEVCLSVETCRHYAHEECMTNISECPRCSDLKNRILISENSDCDKEEIGPLYCQQVKVLNGTVNGFRASAKLRHLTDWVKKLPKRDKALIVSFFKGSLDLIEAILTYELQINCSRIDGDVSASRRDAELNTFKTDPSCRILLATVQTGGTGLNIVEANHIYFVDRWFNPQVHRQAEDRCFRIKQTKPVFVHYNDVATTIDQVMECLNSIKSTNAKVVLADGSSLGASTENLTYKELSGVIATCLRFVAAYRQTQLLEPGRSTLLRPIQNNEFAILIEESKESRLLSYGMEQLKNAIMSLRADPQQDNSITKAFIAEVFKKLCSPVNRSRMQAVANKTDNKLRSTPDFRISGSAPQVYSAVADVSNKLYTKTAEEQKSGNCPSYKASVPIPESVLSMD